MKKNLIFNPIDKFYKSVTGAVAEGEKVAFKIKGDFYSVYFVYHKDGGNDLYFPMEKRGDVFFVSLDFSVGLYWYKFLVNDNKFLGCGVNETGVLDENSEYFLLLVYDKNYKVPKWLNGGIIYQIFPDRFYRSENADINTCGRYIHKNLNDDPFFLPDENGEVTNNDFYGGNLKGITEKLSYLKSLNVSAIYLNPIFKAFSNHRYDTGDFMEIDPLLGSIDDLKELIVKAKNVGISIILDGVFNHVGSDSIYFNKNGSYKSVGAFQSKNSPYYSWFNFISYPEKYLSWWGIKTLPTVNKTNPNYIEYICGKNGVLEKYLNIGVDGFRLDVVDELPDNFVKRLRECVKASNKDAIIIGEVWEDASDKISYGKRREYFLGKELDSVMNYPLKNAIIDYVKTGNSFAFSKIVRRQLNRYPKMVLDCLMNILSTHDTARLLSAVSDESIEGKTKIELSKICLKEGKEQAIFRLKTATVLQFTLFGVPSIFYGDEIGMEGFFDPFNRRFFKWDDQNSEILDWYKLLGEIRNNHDAFIDGDFQEIYLSDGFYCFTRKGKNSELLIVTNVKNGRFLINFNGKLKNLLNGKVYSDKIEVGKNFLGIFKKISKNR